MELKNCSMYSKWFLTSSYIENYNEDILSSKRNDIDWKWQKSSILRGGTKAPWVLKLIEAEIRFLYSLVPSLSCSSAQ